MNDQKDNPFASLAALKATLPPGPPVVSQTSAGPETDARPTRAVIRRERKGRRGKEVSVVEQLGLGREGLEALLKVLKGQLGCGGAVEGDNLILQGDHRERIAEILKARGVKRISIG